MTPVEATFFLGEARTHGIGVNPVYAHNWPRNLSFCDKPGDCRYWVAPEEPDSLSSLIAAMLDSLGNWGHVVLWPKCAPFDAVLRNEDIAELTRLADSLPALHSNGGTRFERSEALQLVALVEALMQHGWSWPTDVYIVPDSFDVVMMVDHHDAIDAQFASVARCDEFVQAMALRGFPLADERPDGTFIFKPDGTM